MVRRPIAILSCVLVLAAATTACSHPPAKGVAGIDAVGSATPTTSLTPTPTLTAGTSTSTSTGTGTQPATTPTTSRPAHGGSTPKPSKSASAEPADADYGVSWSNADCEWIVRSDGSATVQASLTIGATDTNTDGTVKLTITHDAGATLGGTAEIFGPSKLMKGSTSLNPTENGTGADLINRTITFVATLTFDGVPDSLDADNVNKLAIHFPGSFQANNEGVENLGCTHVN
jgi:hypothetical protein